MKTSLYYKFAAIFFISSLLTGCTTVSVYESPITKFQTSVATANDSVKTYLLGINDVIARGNLYTVYGYKTNWVAGDFQAGIPDDQIQLRLKALNTIADYANALAAIAQSKDVENFQQAAKTLGTNVDNLGATVSAIDSNDKWSIDLKDPVTACVTLVGTEAIQGKQKAAVESAIINGSTNIDAIIDKLKLDVPNLSTVVSTFEEQIWNGKLKSYDMQLRTAGPQQIDSLISQSVADYDSIKALTDAQLLPVLDNMENAHRALVVFAKSKKSPKDLADLADQIDVFSVHVTLFANTVSSIQRSTNPTK